MTYSVSSGTLLKPYYAYTYKAVCLQVIVIRRFRNCIFNDVQSSNDGNFCDVFLKENYFYTEKYMFYRSI